jgi:hypothetical protein
MNKLNIKTLVAGGCVFAPTLMAQPLAETPKSIMCAQNALSKTDRLFLKNTK